MMSSPLTRHLHEVSFKDHRYEVELSWKEFHPPLPNNYNLCQRRLAGLLRRLKQDPDLYCEYKTVIKDQMRKRIVEFVTDSPTLETGKIHYLPHHVIMKQDKSTSKLRIVYDASAKPDGPSLYDQWPKFWTVDIILQF